jgi:hypothetical protein
MQGAKTMNTFVADTIARLIELNRLEDRLEEIKTNQEKSSDVQVLIESLRANISVTVLMNHERLRVRGRRSIAEVQHGVCSGCHMSLAIGNIHSLHRGEELLKCGNCGRYVFLEREDYGAKESTAAKRKSSREKAKPALAAPAD